MRGGSVSMLHILHMLRMLLEMKCVFTHESVFVAGGRAPALYLL